MLKRTIDGGQASEKLAQQKVATSMAHAAWHDMPIDVVARILWATTSAGILQFGTVCQLWREASLLSISSIQLKVQPTVAIVRSLGVLFARPTRLIVPTRKLSIGAEGAAALAAANWPSLATVDVTDNSIGAEGAAALATAEWRSLTSLDVSENSIGAEGAAALAAAEWRSLTSLNVRSNSIGDEGAAALATAEWRSLTSLDVSNNSIGVEGTAALATAEWRSLTSLDVSHNSIGAGGVAALAAAEWRSLTSLNVQGNRAKGAVALKKAFASARVIGVA